MHDEPHDHFCTWAVGQYAARANCAGRWRAVLMLFCETAVGLPFASFPDPKLMPKSGVGAACARVAKAAAPKRELRRMRTMMGRCERM